MSGFDDLLDDKLDFVQGRLWDQVGAHFLGSDCCVVFLGPCHDF
jgi:hypothetical protein